MPTVSIDPLPFAPATLVGRVVMRLPIATLSTSTRPRTPSSAAGGRSMATADTTEYYAR
jgi:hypothetical protein